LVAVALVISIGVIPVVVADTTPGFNAGSGGVFLWITVVLDLLAAAILAFALWRSREHDHFSRGTLGLSAFLALLVALAYAGVSGVIAGHGPALRTASVVPLVLCAVFALITTALVTVTSVIVDRARWPA
jgi:hypothetical protein